MIGLPGGARGHDWEHGFLQRTIALWDISQIPITNDREAKLGAQVHQRGGAIHAYDDETNLLTPVDGVSNTGEDPTAPEVQGQPTPTKPIPFTAEQLFEPDNWVLRYHTENGYGKDNTWDVRLISDHTNEAASRTMRSTFVIDQEGFQAWGALSDLIWITDKTAENNDQEMAYNFAGYLAMLYAEPTAEQARHAVALNVAWNAGLVTDGSNIGPFAHVLAFRTGGGGVGGTSAGGGGGRPASEVDLCLKADAAYRYPNGKTICWPTIEKAPEDAKEEGKEYRVIFHEGDDGGAEVNMSTDSLSNMATQMRQSNPKLAAYVKVPTYPPGYTDKPTYDGSYHSEPPGQPNDPSGTGESGKELPTVGTDEENPNGDPADYPGMSGEDPMNPEPFEDDEETAARKFREEQYLERIVNDANTGGFTTQGASAGYAGR